MPSVFENGPRVRTLSPQPWRGIRPRENMSFSIHPCRHDVISGITSIYSRHDVITVITSIYSRHDVITGRPSVYSRHDGHNELYLNAQYRSLHQFTVDRTPSWSYYFLLAADLTSFRTYFDTLGMTCGVYLDSPSIWSVGYCLSLPAWCNIELISSSSIWRHVGHILIPRWCDVISSLIRRHQALAGTCREKTDLW